MIACFILGVFSISQLVNLASQENATNIVKQQVANIRKSKPIESVNTLIKSHNTLSCEKLRHHILFNTLKEHPAFQASVCCSCEVNSQMAKVSSQEQDYTIRLNLIQGAFEYFQSELDQILQSQPSMPKVPLYVYSFISWISVTIFSHFLTRLADKFFFTKLGFN